MSTQRELAFLMASVFGLGMYSGPTTRVVEIDCRKSYDYKRRSHGGSTWMPKKKRNRRGRKGGEGRSGYFS
jgi:hypothetical protein